MAVCLFHVCHPPGRSWISIRQQCNGSHCPPAFFARRTEYRTMTLSRLAFAIVITGLISSGSAFAQVRLQQPAGVQRTAFEYDAYFARGEENVASPSDARTVSNGDGCSVAPSCDAGCDGGCNSCCQDECCNAVDCGEPCRYFDRFFCECSPWRAITSCSATW